jgi:hypothetical protein
MFKFIERCRKFGQESLTFQSISLDIPSNSRADSLGSQFAARIPRQSLINAIERPNHSLAERQNEIDGVSHIAIGRTYCFVLNGSAGSVNTTRAVEGSVSVSVSASASVSRTEEMAF